MWKTPLLRLVVGNIRYKTDLAGAMVLPSVFYPKKQINNSILLGLYRLKAALGSTRLNNLNLYVRASR